MTKALIKTKKQEYVALPLSQYLVKQPFAAITAASLLGFVSTSFAHLETAISAQSYIMLHYIRLRWRQSKCCQHLGFDRRHLGFLESKVSMFEQENGVDPNASC